MLRSSANRVNRGNDDVANFNRHTASNTNSNYGWRPALLCFRPAGQGLQAKGMRTRAHCKGEHVCCQWLMPFGRKPKEGVTRCIGALAFFAGRSRCLTA